MEVEASKLLLIPVGLVQWMLAGARTPWDFHEKIMEKICEKGENITPTGMEMSLNWCLKGAMIQMGTTGCHVLKSTAVIRSDPVTIGWIKQRLDTTLGT